jgi:hypothetical protein
MEQKIICCFFPDFVNLNRILTAKCFNELLQLPFPALPVGQETV